jgi:hypothetical protein
MMLDRKLEKALKSFLQECVNEETVFNIVNPASGITSKIPVYDARTFNEKVFPHILISSSSMSLRDDLTQSTGIYDVTVDVEIASMPRDTGDSIHDSISYRVYQLFTDLELLKANLNYGFPESRPVEGLTIFDCEFTEKESDVEGRHLTDMLTFTFVVGEDDTFPVLT